MNCVLDGKAYELFNGKEPIAYKAWLFMVRWVAPILLTMVLFDVATH